MKAGQRSLVSVSYRLFPGSNDATRVNPVISPANAAMMDDTAACDVSAFRHDDGLLCSAGRNIWQ